MANIEKTSYGQAGFQFGDNIAESATITSDAEVPVGTVLVRGAGKNWTPATSSTLKAGVGLGVAIAPVEAGVEVPCDVGVGGRFNRSKILVGSDAVTDEQADLLRGQGIIALTVKELGTLN